MACTRTPARRARRVHPHGRPTQRHPPLPSHPHAGTCARIRARTRPSPRPAPRATRASQPPHMATREASDLLAVTPSRSGSPRQAAETLASARPTARRKWKGSAEHTQTQTQTRHGSREEEEQPIESSAMCRQLCRRRQRGK